MSNVALIVGTLILFAVVIVAYFMCDSSAEVLVVDTERVQRRQRSRLALMPDVKARTKSRLETQSIKMPPVAPMWWDKEEGAFMIQLIVGAGLVELVVDTGSSQLSAKGNGCMWTNCDSSDGNEVCETQACPCGTLPDGSKRKECTQFYYRPIGRALSPGQEGAGTKTRLTYGSQEDSVSHYMDRIAIPHVSVPCDALSVTVPTPNTMKPGPPLEIGEVVVHRVHHIQGESSSNLFGLACPPLDESKRSTEQGKSVVLEKLYKANPIVWSIVLRPRGGWWAMGALPCFDRVAYMPLQTPSSFHQYVTQFYVLKVVRFEVGPTKDSMLPVSSAKTPRYCVIDTGTTYTYGPLAFGAALDKLGYDERSWFVRLTLGDALHPVSILYSPKQMADPEFPNSSVLQVSEGRTLGNFDDIFPKNDVLLLGAYMMCNCYWEFDIARRRVGVQPLD